VARYLGMTVPALRQKAAAGQFPVVRLDYKFRFYRRELDRLIDHAKRDGV
jgi:hypothetical protein